LFSRQKIKEVRVRVRNAALMTLRPIQVPATAGEIVGSGISTLALDLGSGIPTGCGLFDVKDKKVVGRRCHNESHNVYYVN